MRSKPPFQIVSLFLLAGLLLTACTPAAQPTVETLDTPAESPATSIPSPSPAPPQPTEVPTQEPVASGCPLTGDRIYTNTLYGYCFAYPEGFTVQIQNAQGPSLVGTPLEEAADPLHASLAISARPVPQGADLGGLVSGFLSQSPFPDMPDPIGRTPLEWGGAPAEALEPVPGRLSSRVVLALHDTTLFVLYFNPVDMPQAQASVEALYQTVLDSFTFFPVAPQIPTGPDRANYFAFERIFSFDYDPSLALLVEARDVDAVPLSPDVMFAESRPAFAQFNFLGFNGGRASRLPYPFQNAQLMVFPTREFSGFSAETQTGFPQQLQALRSLLQAQPDLAERCSQTLPVSGETALPFLPWVNSAQVFCAQPAYIQFGNGKGIRYLTAFSQGVEPVLDPQVFYTFQGLSEDGEFYYSAVFPVLSGIFPLEVHPGVDGQLPVTLTAEQLSALNAQPGDLFQPALGLLDSLVSSLHIEK